jgi:hypothetical protein
VDPFLEEQELLSIRILVQKSVWGREDSPGKILHRKNLQQMNSFSMWIARKLRELGVKSEEQWLRKKQVKNAKVSLESEFICSDQLLFEFFFTDKALLCVYEKTIICTCSSSRSNMKCSHVKILLKEGNIAHFDQFSFFNDLRKARKLPVLDLDVSDESEDDDLHSSCRVCFVKFSKETRVVKCPKCNCTIHKACWNKWKIARQTSSIMMKYTYRDECILCRAPGDQSPVNPLV